MNAAATFRLNYIHLPCGLWYQKGNKGIEYASPVDEKLFNASGHCHMVPPNHAPPHICVIPATKCVERVQMCIENRLRHRHVVP